MKEYYTYAYLREDGTPYYVGKGKGIRIHKKSKGEVFPPQDKGRVIKLKQNLTEEEAFKHEIYMIAILGRKDLGTGILRNKTNGGEGVSGLIINEEHRKKLSDALRGRPSIFKGKPSPLKGRKLTEEHKRKLSEAKYNQSEETRKKLSEARKGKKLSEETREKMRQINTGKKHSEETKKKMSASQKKRHQKKKQ